MQTPHGHVGARSASPNLKHQFLVALPLIALVATCGSASAAPLRGATSLQIPVRGAAHHRASPDNVVYSSYSFPSSNTMGYIPAGGVASIGTNVYVATTGGAAYGAGGLLKIAQNLQPASASVLYNFGQYSPDGSFPPSAPIVVGTKLYGTSGFGGSSGYGGTYVYDTSGGPSPYAFHSFTGSGPTQPSGPLVQKSGNTFFGVSNAGGIGYGTFYKTTGPNNTATTCFIFNGITGDNAVGNLVKAGSFYYGVTSTDGSYGKGVVFKIKQNCQLMWTWSFGGPGDGIQPLGGLVAVGSVFYGTTSGGGANGLGTIFQIDASGNEHVVYSFSQNGTNGTNPSGSIYFNGTSLDGTTTHGGGPCTQNANGCGTVYQYNLPPSPTSYSTLHVFLGGTADGQYPTGISYDPTDAGLYGTTPQGGSGLNGTIWSLVCPSCQ